jgi:hypothetical protein
MICDSDEMCETACVVLCERSVLDLDRKIILKTILNRQSIEWIKLAQKGKNAARLMYG